MILSRLWIALAALALLGSGLPAGAVVVLDEDFEDDVVDDSANFIIDGNGDQILVQHFQNGPPTNVGNAGTWIANKYKVGSPTEDGQGYQGGQWFDPDDVNPDTDWQFGLLRDYRKAITLPPQSQTGENRDTRIPERAGNEGHLVSHHQGDCNQAAARPCDVVGEVGFFSARLNRGGFIQFADAAGNPVIAEEGDTLKFSMEFSGADGNTALGFTNDIQAMVDRTADEDLNPPYSKWNVGFGQPFVPLQPDLGGWQGYVMDPHVVIQVEFISGFNQEYFGSRLQNADTVGTEQCLEGNGVNCSRNVELIPDTDQCYDVPLSLGECGPLTDASMVREGVYGDWNRYQTLELEYTVGDTLYKMWLDGVEVSTEEEGGFTKGEPIPVSQLPFQVDGTDMGLIGPLQIDGLIIGATGDRNSYGANKNSTSLVVDNLFAEIIKANGGGPLLGDANNDNQVTGADLISVQQNFGKDYTNGACDGMGLGDANDDCLVTGADLISVQQNFGKTAAAQIPEPAVMALLGLGLVSLLRRRNPNKT